MSDFFRLTVGILCVWRITHLLHAEDGPWNVFVHIRRTAGNGFFGQLLDCFYCLSLWVSAPFAVATSETIKEGALFWIALSAGAILLERVTSKSFDAAPVSWYEEDKEE